MKSGIPRCRWNNPKSGESPWLAEFRWKRQGEECREERVPGSACKTAVPRMWQTLPTEWIQAYLGWLASNSHTKSPWTQGPWTMVDDRSSSFTLGIKVRMLEGLRTGFGIRNSVAVIIHREGTVLAHLAYRWIDICYICLMDYLDIYGSLEKYLPVTSKMVAGLGGVHDSSC